MLSDSKSAFNRNKCVIRKTSTGSKIGCIRGISITTEIQRKTTEFVCKKRVINIFVKNEKFLSHFKRKQTRNWICSEYNGFLLIMFLNIPST